MKILLIREHLRNFFLFCFVMPVFGMTLGFLAGIAGSAILCYFGVMHYHEGKYITIFMSIGFFFIALIVAIPMFLAHFKALLKFNRLSAKEQKTILDDLNK